jgi:hypothetical protein
LVEELLDVAEDNLRSSADIGAFRRKGEDAPVQISDGDVNTCRPKIGDEHVPSIRIELDLQRWTSSTARVPARFDDESGGVKLAKPLCDDRPTEPRLTRDKRPRARAPHTKKIEQDAQVTRHAVS